MIDPVQAAAMLTDSRDDEYRLRMLAFQPDVIYDIGACVGGFALWAAEVFPDATIVSVEPQEDNYRVLVDNTAHLPQVVTVHAALAADKQVSYHPNSPGIGNWIFVSESSPTYDAETTRTCEVTAITLDELYVTYGGQRYVVKLDCESGEMMIVTHKPSRRIATGAAYLTGEFHLWGRTHEILTGAMRQFFWWLYTLQTTHDVDAAFRGGMAMIYATRRPGADMANDWDDVVQLMDEQANGQSE